MRRAEFEHVIAAAADIAGEDEIVVIGSQAILGTHPNPPPELLRSLEADVYPRSDPAKADLIDAMIGDGSRFHETFGYYAHGVSPETARAPAGWHDRLVRTPIPARVSSSRTAQALCLEPHDLVLSKCAAGRRKDWEYADAAIRAGIVDVETMRRRVKSLPVSAEQQRQIDEHLRAVRPG